MGFRIKLIPKRGITNLKLRHRSKHHKGATRIKKIKHSKMKNAVKLERKFRITPFEETVEIRKLNDSEPDICADRSPVADPKPSHTLLFDKVSDYG
jgi:hypothetical protein